MKIAVVTDDGQTISQHFGLAPKYVVLTFENGQVIERQVKDRVHHNHAGHADDPLHTGRHHNHDHAAMLDPIADCQIGAVCDLARKVLFEQAHEGHYTRRSSCVIAARFAGKIEFHPTFWTATVRVFFERV